MGIAILSGILSSLRDMQSAAHSLRPPPISTTSTTSGTSTPQEEVPSRLPTRFIACVRRPESAKKVKAALAPYLPSSSVSGSPVTIAQNDNVSAVRKADVVLLACKPYMMSEILGEAGMAEALRGKLLISILAGVPAAQIESQLASSASESQAYRDNPALVVRAMPNTASQIRESMTVIGARDPPLPAEASGLVTWIFRRIGDVVHLPPSTMDACTALCGSGPAFFALMLEAAIDGAVAMGLPRAEAQRMAAQTMRGTAGLVLNGDHPALLRDKVSTPGGCTIGGLLVLEEGRVRGTVARAVREATVVASQLGQGVQGVNGTRFGGSQFQ